VVASASTAGSVTSAAASVAGASVVGSATAGVGSTTGAALSTAAATTGSSTVFGASDMLIVAVIVVIDVSVGVLKVLKRGLMEEEELGYLWVSDQRDEKEVWRRVKEKVGGRFIRLLGQRQPQRDYAVSG
jgi:hypothetical protein